MEGSIIKPDLAVRVITCTALFALAFICLAAAVARPSGAREDATPAYNSSNLIRLHVAAPGDDAHSQRLKLTVRDTVLEETGMLLKSAKDARDAARILRDNLSVIESSAQAALAKSGASHRARAALGVFAFPSVSYGATSLPAGDYLALKVEIGSASGTNWWCVLFPPLCPVDLERARILETAGAPPGYLDSTGRATPSGGRLFTLEFAVHRDPPAGAFAKSEAVLHQAALNSGRLTLARLNWEIPAWACRILRWPHTQQASYR